MINNLSMRKFKCIISISLGTYVHIKFTKRKWQHLQLTQTMLFRIKWDLRAFHWNALNTSILFKDPSCKPLFSSFKIVSYIICNNQMNDTKKKSFTSNLFRTIFSHKALTSVVLKSSSFFWSLSTCSTLFLVFISTFCCILWNIKGYFNVGI